ncbi:MAG: YcxB family protein [Oscillibacter sp.]|nr:YcxB family protein [Oscillibacter sp.]
MEYQRDFTIGVKETQDFYVGMQLAKWRGGLLGFGAVGVLTAWMYLGMLAPALEGAGKLAAAVGIGAAVMAVIVACMVLFTRQKVAAQVRASGRTQYVQQTEINGFGVHVTVEKDKAKLPFDRIHKVRETKKAIYIHLSDTQAWILPKSQMAGEEEAARLLEMLSSVIESGRLQLRKR